jgi:putative transposase
VARSLRENVNGGIYHVYARGNNRAVVFPEDLDCLIYLRMLGRTVANWRWHCLAFCLMGNHLHLLLETPEGNLSPGMQYLHGRYALDFNRRHLRTGHVFQGRYGAVRMTEDRQLCAAAGYIARNPVQAGLCAQPEDWPWSSFRGVVGGRVPDWVSLDRLLTFFGSTASEARKRYVTLSTNF